MIPQFIVLKISVRPSTFNRGTHIKIVSEEMQQSRLIWFAGVLTSGDLADEIDSVIIWLKENDIPVMGYGLGKSDDTRYVIVSESAMPAQLPKGNVSNK